MPYMGISEQAARHRAENERAITARWIERCVLVAADLIVGWVAGCVTVLVIG